MNLDGTQSPSGRQHSPAGASTVGSVSVCGVKPCVVVVTGSVVGCGRRNPEPRNRSYKGPRQLSQSCACKKGGKGGAHISTWTGGLVPRRLLGRKERMARVVYVVCMCVRREVLEGVGGSVLKC